MKHKGKSNPPGRRKIIGALRELLSAKNFQAITTAEIANTAGVTEGLIYKYFSDKNDLLYQLLQLHFTEFVAELSSRMDGCGESRGKLEIIVRTTLESYAGNRVFARILLLEVRNSPSYFSSEAYEVVRQYAENVLNIIEEGREKGELRADTDALVLRKILFGTMEHACLGEVIFGRKLDVEKTTSAIMDILFNGVKPS